MALLYSCDMCCRMKAAEDMLHVVMPFLRKNEEITIYDIRKMDLCLDCSAKIHKAMQTDKYAVVEKETVKRPYTKRSKSKEES